VNESQIFANALKRSTPAERAAYLDEACAGSPELRTGVEALLRAHADHPGFLEKPAGSLWATVDGPAAPALDVPRPVDAGVAELPGVVLAGRYKLLQLIGEGGMGTVWMAEQTQPVQRKVALKLVKSGMDSRQVIARFEAERQALALMDHPNIARVLDAGEVGSRQSSVGSQEGLPTSLPTADCQLRTGVGRPFFVMELVKGVPITKYCDEHHLTPRQRLELFVPVCQAVQHAHQKGIIHRDIKPSNVLVCQYDGRPVPKVIDFGVAKATGPRLTEKTLFTELGAVVGTLEYMSPEQAELNQLDIDTRSDIYSMGVLLYELLTGTTPLERKRFRTAGFLEVLRLIREEEPPRPSTRLSEASDTLPSISAQRQMEPAKLTKLVRGELDWIVMKALEKDRNRRYESANEFALDVQRYLADEQVMACPPSAWYRFEKFARRNKAAIAIPVVVILAGLMLLSGVLWHNKQLAAEVKEKERKQLEAQSEARRADGNFAKAMEAVEKFLSQIGHKRLEQVPGMEKIRRETLEQALVFFQGFLDQNGEKPVVRWEAALAYFRVGLIENLLGRHDRAEQSYRRAVELLEALTTEFPATADVRALLADCQTNLAVLLRDTGRPREAEPALRDALKIRGELLGEHPGEQVQKGKWAQNHVDLATVLHELGKNEEAERVFRSAVSMHEKLTADFPGVLEYRDDLARCHLNYGLLLKRSGRPAKAEVRYRRAVELWEKLRAESPAGAAYRYELVGGHLNLGVLLEESSRQKEAESAYRRALELAEKLTNDFPSVPNYRSLAAGVQLNLATLLGKTGRSKEGEQVLRRTIDLQGKLVADFPRVPEYRRNLIGAMLNLGAQLYGTKRLDEAGAMIGKAVGLLQELAASSADPADRFRLAMGHYNLAILQEEIGKPAEAEDNYRKALEVLERLVADFPKAVDYHHVLGMILNNVAQYPMERGQFAEMRELAEKAIEHQRIALKGNPRHPGYREALGNHYRSLTGALVLLGKHAEAMKAAADAPKLSPASWYEYVRAAEYAASCVPLAEKDAGLPDKQRRTLARAYADQAMTWLREAVAWGLKDAGQITRRTAYEPLRMRGDYLDLVKELKDKQPGAGGKEKVPAKPCSTTSLEPSEYRQGARRRDDWKRAGSVSDGSSGDHSRRLRYRLVGLSFLRHGVGQGPADYQGLRLASADAQGVSGPVHPGLPGEPARSSEGHPPRHQTE
jgi:serine/threonine protein kinase